MKGTKKPPKTTHHRGTEESVKWKGGKETLLSPESLCRCTLTKKDLNDNRDKKDPRTL